MYRAPYRNINRRDTHLRVVDYIYYDSGNGVSLLKRAQADNGTSDAYTYNEYGQVLSHTQTTDTRTFVSTYASYSWGRMIRQTSPNGYVQNFTYSDADSRLF